MAIGVNWADGCWDDATWEVGVWALTFTVHVAWITAISGGPPLRTRIAGGPPFEVALAGASPLL